MDIFTILVFFLLVNSSDVEVLPNAKDVQLPESIAETKARENVVILVTETDILVQGRVVAALDDVVLSTELVIASLKDALMAQTDRALRQDEMAEIENREVTIMGDREIPYHVLKKIMATCTSADYGRLSLAVLQKAPDVQLAASGPGGA
jgi:biopolymer transport protein ExbD